MRRRQPEPTVLGPDFKERLRAAVAAAAETRAMLPRLLDGLEEVEDAFWDKAMRPVEVPLKRTRRRLAWNGEFLVVSVEHKKKIRWDRLTEAFLDEVDVLTDACAALRELAAQGGLVLKEQPA